MALSVEVTDNFFSTFKLGLKCHANYLHRQFAWNVKPCFLRKKKETNISKLHLLKCYIMKNITHELSAFFLQCSQYSLRYNPYSTNHNCSRRHFEIFFFFYFLKDIRLAFFLWIICQADNSNEIARLIFCWKINVKKIRMSSATNLAWQFKSWIKIFYLINTVRFAFITPKSPIN